MTDKKPQNAAASDKPSQPNISNGDASPLSGDASQSALPSELQEVKPSEGFDKYVKYRRQKAALEREAEEAAEEAARAAQEAEAAQGKKSKRRGRKPKKGKKPGDVVPAQAALASDKKPAPNKATEAADQPAQEPAATSAIDSIPDAPIEESAPSKSADPSPAQPAAAQEEPGQQSGTYKMSIQVSTKASGADAEPDKGASPPAETAATDEKAEKLASEEKVDSAAGPTKEESTPSQEPEVPVKPEPASEEAKQDPESTQPSPSETPDTPAPPATLLSDAEQVKRRYWRANLGILAVLLTVWFVVSFGFGILFVDQLNAYEFYGFKVGFWWAQQGSIYVFVLLIFIYSMLMNWLDNRYRKKVVQSQTEGQS